MQKLLLVFYLSENCATSQIWKILPNMVFPPIWGEKMAAFWACACKLSWTLLSPARVQSLYGAGRKESSGTGVGSAWFECRLRHPSFCCRWCNIFQFLLKGDVLRADESCAIIHTVHRLRLIYEAKIQVLSVFSWKPAQPRYVKTKSLLFLEA